VVQTIAGVMILLVYVAVGIVGSHHVGCLCVEKHHLSRMEGRLLEQPGCRKQR
jgi:hypothetical protein